MSNHKIYNIFFSDELNVPRIYERELIKETKCYYFTEAGQHSKKNKYWSKDLKQLKLLWKEILADNLAKLEIALKNHNHAMNIEK